MPRSIVYPPIDMTDMTFPKLLNYDIVFLYIFLFTMPRAISPSIKESRCMVREHPLREKTLKGTCPLSGGGGAI